MLLPRLSVAIPTYRRADVLADRLRRMAAMGDRIELEISISDNASPDHTREVIEQFRHSFAKLHYIRQERLVSPIFNFYAALRSTTFDLVTIIGDDDTVAPDAMREVLAMFGRDPELQAVIGNNELFDFKTEKALGITRFVHEQERYTHATAHELFSKYYFFEYLVMRRRHVHRWFHNEGFSYPIGWKLLHSCLREGAVELVPLPIITKSDSADQMGLRNYIIEIQDLPRADPEIFAALALPAAKDDAARASLRQAALMRTVRYSSDSTINAKIHGLYLVSLHHAQKASLYDYDTKFYPKVAADLLLFNRLAEWLVPMVKAVTARKLVLEETAACRRLTEYLTPHLPGLAFSFLPLAQMKAEEGIFAVTHHFSVALAKAAEVLPGVPYCALSDLIPGICEKPADEPLMRQLLADPPAAQEQAA